MSETNPFLPLPAIPELSPLPPYGAPTPDLERNLFPSMMMPPGYVIPLYPAPPSDVGYSGCVSRMVKKIVSCGFGMLTALAVIVLIYYFFFKDADVETEVLLPPPVATAKRGSLQAALDHLYAVPTPE